MRKLIIYTYLLIVTLISSDVSSNDKDIPNLVGTWVGVNNTLSEQRGYRSWEKKLKSLNRRIEGLRELFHILMVQKTFWCNPS